MKNVITGFIKNKIMLSILGSLGVPGFIIIGILLIVLIIILAVVGGTSSNNFDSDIQFGQDNLSPHVLAYKDTVQKYAEQEGIAEHVPIILAMMQQESGGMPDVGDPMQSSESLCGYVGCIKSPDLSIKQGVSYFKQVLESAEGDVKLAIQSYNFGGGFVNYVLNKNGKYTFNKTLGDKQTYDLAIQFSQEQYQRQIQLGNGAIYTCIRAEAKPFNACYGDILYVWAVMQYVLPQGSGDWLHGVQGHYQMTSPFGPRIHPITGEVGKMHNGVDFSCQRQHLPIVAVDDGVVVVSTFGVSGSGFGGFGNVVVIKHNNNLYSLYGHLHERSAIVGENVTRGQAIGTCGNTGASAGIHLHLEARTSLHGGQFDPMTLIEGNKE